MFAFVAGVLAATSARGQTVRNSGATAAPVQIQIMGNVSSSLQLSIVGAGKTTLTGTTATLPGTPAVGTVDFGSFNTLQPQIGAQGDAFRITSPTPGAIVAARLIATLTYQGVTTGSITVARKFPAGGLPDIPLPDLRLASPAFSTWTSSTQGLQVPNAGAPGADICVAAGDVTCQSGTPYEHQIAIFLPDSRPAGSFSTVVVYTAVAP